MKKQFFILYILIQTQLLFGADALQRCATPQLSEARKIVVEEEMNANLNTSLFKRQGSMTINTYWNVITSGSTGDIPQNQINSQMNVLNQAYIGTGFSFYLARVKKTNNAQWMNIYPQTSQDSAMKNSLNFGGNRDLNLYSTTIQGGVLGYAFFPEAYRSQPKMDGVVFDYRTVPGGSLSPYNQGHTLTHEVGHWLGLYHTFEGGCNSPGDSVSDTPPEATETSGCPSSKDTCPGGGVDPIHNYMDYSDDSCMNEFSAGQVSRMQAQFSTYRTSPSAETITTKAASPVTTASTTRQPIVTTGTTTNRIVTTDSTTRSVVTTGTTTRSVVTSGSTRAVTTRSVVTTGTTTRSVVTSGSTTNRVVTTGSTTGSVVTTARSATATSTTSPSQSSITTKTSRSSTTNKLTTNKGSTTGRTKKKFTYRFDVDISAFDSRNVNLGLCKLLGFEEVDCSNDYFMDVQIWSGSTYYSFSLGGDLSDKGEELDQISTTELEDLTGYQVLSASSQDEVNSEVIMPKQDKILGMSKGSAAIVFGSGSALILIIVALVVIIVVIKKKTPKSTPQYQSNQSQYEMNMYNGGPQSGSNPLYNH